MSRIPKSLADLDFSNLTTTGRKSGLPRIIETWFAVGARIVKDGQEEDARARRLLAAKYQGWAVGKKLSG